MMMDISVVIKNIKRAVLLLALAMTACVSEQQVFERDQDLLKVKARARSHTDLGAVYFQQNKLEIALEEFNEAARIDPTFGLAYNGLGLVQAALGQDKLAEANFKKAIEIDPSNSESHNNYGSFLCARNRYDESIGEFLSAVKNPLYATPAMAYTNAGICAARKKDTVSAENYLQRALQIEPLSNSVAYQLASIQWMRNDAVAAKKSLQNVMLAQPGPEVLWLAIKIERALKAKNVTIKSNLQINHADKVESNTGLQFERTVSLGVDDLPQTEPSVRMEDVEASYTMQLQNQYPDSEQAKLLQSGK